MIHAIASLALCALQGSPVADPPRPLFDGRTLQGWSGDPRYWSVEDGAIVGRSTPELPCKRTTWLIFEGAPLEHFELSLEVRLNGGNSGVQVRSSDLGEWQVHGPQADHDAAGDWTGGIYEQGGRGVLVPRGTSLTLDAAGAAESTRIGDAAALLEQATAREWAQLDIKCLGAATEVRWNGVLTSKLIDGGPAAWHGDGKLALQLHAGPPMEVRFRNVLVRELAAPPIEAVPARPKATAPQWIWAPGAPSDNETATLLRQVTPRAALTRATLWGACDNAVEVFVGERRIAVSEDWAKPFERDVTQDVGSDPFTLTARCWNEGGPAGLVLRLTLTYADGTTETIVTDDSWHTLDGAAAVSRGAFGVAPWGTPATSSDGAPRGVLDPAQLELPAGFAATLLYEVPRRDGSWVAVTCDDRGRIYAADERGQGVFRLTERPDGPPTVEALPLNLPAAQGLCPIRRADGGLDLYIMVSAFGSPRANGLWRARDADDDGVFEAVDLLMPLDGAGEHGPHAIVAAPDGSGLYVIAGNHTKLPADIEVFHAPKLWQEDQLLPRIPDPNGHAVGVPVPGGWFVKTDFEGQHRELVSIGMRNAYDFAVDREGNTLTYDSDMEWDMGAPWYRAPRVLQLVPGGDFGWRNGSGKVPAWSEDTLGAVVDTGPASPTGVLHTKDLAFHAPWDNVLLAADWAYGTVHAVTTTRAEDGLTLTGTIRPFLSGKPFPVTDLAAHPDGSLIVTIGGRGTRSGVYRIRSLAGVDHRATAAVPDPVGRFATLRAGFDLLSPDRVERYLARVQLERDLTPADWLARFMRKGQRGAADERLSGAWLIGAARAGGSELRERVLAAVSAATWSEHPTATELQDHLAQLRAAELVIARAGVPEGPPGRSVAKSLAHLYPTGDARVDRTLAALLVALGDASVTEKAIAQMLRAPIQEDALYLAYVLRNQTAGWTPQRIDQYLTFLHVDAARFHGGHSLARYVELIRDEATERLGAGWTAPEAVSQAAPARPVSANIFVKEWALDDLRPADGELAQRDLVSGRHVFEAARCAECHRYADSGGSTGPDLTGAGARYSAEDLLLAILEPSRDLTDQYQDTEVWTTDGTVHMGRVVEEDAEWLTLMPPPPNEAERIDVAQREVKLKRPHPTSRMPKGLLNGFQREEVLDLLGYLLGGPQVGAPAKPEAQEGPARDERSSRVHEADLHDTGQPGLAALARAFAEANPGYALRWLANDSAAPATLACAPAAACTVVFAQAGEGAATVTRAAGVETSDVRAGDIIVVRRGESLALRGASALAFDVPTAPPSDIPAFIRPDFDPRITDTPGGCAEESDAYRRVLLTWQGKNGPYLFHALNAHRVRIMDSFTHYHPIEGGFDELYLVQAAPEGAALLVSEQLDVIRGVAAVTKAEVSQLLRRIPLSAGDLVYLPRGVVHRGLGGAVVQVITVPGFVPGAEIGVDAALVALNERFGLAGADALPSHAN
ncbi:MAG: family 16 glycoside hydrolase [Planctomycetota bacterium]